MATADHGGEHAVRLEIDQERTRLVQSVDELRVELERTTDIRALLDARLRKVLPVAAAGAFGAGFVLWGGVGAVARYAFRRSRENGTGEVRARAGRFAVVDRSR